MEARRSRILRIIPLLIAFCLVSMPAQAQYGGGTGEPNNPYQIATAEDLNDIGNHEEDWDKCFILVNDIDLSAYTGTQFNVIGRWFGWGHPDNKAFSGIFDGDGKVIRNFTWSSVDRDMVALFAFLGRNATRPTVKNLGLENVNIRAEDGAYIGALVALNNGGLANCYVTGYVSGEDCMGGLVGFNFLGDIINCHSFATVEGNNDVGGLVGSNGEGDIDLSFSHSTVSGRARVGGLVGNCNGSLRYSFSNSTVTGNYEVGGLVGVNGRESRTVDCYARGSVTGTTGVGGLVGVNYESEMEWLGLIQRCYSSATVRGEGEHIGGLVGFNSGSITSSFWDMDTSGQTTSRGGTGKTTAEMQTARTFFSWGQCDLEVTWKIDEGNDYPRLWWENQPGEPIPARLSSLLPGSGTEDDPYLIYTAEELNLVGLFTCDFDRYFKLMADVDLSAYTSAAFNIIGESARSSFRGVFDGNGKKISNFTYTSMDRDNIGLFGYVDGPNAEIKDLGLIDPDINGRNYVGSLVGHMRTGTISNCYAQGGNFMGDDRVGGLVGVNAGTITNCYSTSSVVGSFYVGGLVGENWGTIIDCNSTGDVSGFWHIGGLVGHNSGEIINCHSFATVEGNTDVGGLVGSNSGDIDLSFSHSTVSGNAYVGGLVGHLWGFLRYSFSNSTVTGNRGVGGLVGINNGGDMIVDCYARGSVTGTTLVGGLVGGHYESEDEGPGLIQSCYSSATVRGEGESIGGLVGWNSADIISCFWDRQASGMDNMCGEGCYDVDCDDSRGKTTAEMQMASTFIGLTGCGNEGIWTIDEGVDYPRLWWENKPGESLSEQLSDFLEGTGELNAPYLIYTAEQLNVIGLFPCEWDKNFKLMADIDLTRYVGDEFNIIGIDYRYAFTGVFDGNGKRISNFTYISMDRDNIGLFGYVVSWENDVVIKDLGLIDPNIDAPTADRVGALVGHLYGILSNCYVRGGTVLGDDYVGGLVGDNSGSITSSYSTSTVGGTGDEVGGLVGSNGGSIATSNSTGAVTGSGRFVGGLVGYNDGGSIVACYSNGVVSGGGRVGGLAGRNCYGGNIAMSYSTGTVSGTDWGIGGLVGQNSMGGSITTSYSTSAVSGYRSVGGLVGRNSRYGSIATSFSTGTVTGNEDVGGFVGRNQGESAVVSTCFWDTETSGLLNMCGSQDEDATGCDDSYGKTTAEMQTASTFLEAGWDFVDETVNGPNDIWKISEGLDYPHLWWEKYSGGSGEPNEPYLIYTAEQMNQIGLHEEDWDKHFKLMADIDLSAYTGTQFNCIGSCQRCEHDCEADEMYGDKPFSGIFDGNNKTISNFTWQSNGEQPIGLFKYICVFHEYVEGQGWVVINPGTVMNLTLRNVNVSDPNSVGPVGSLVGSGGRIVNCSATGSVIAPNANDIGGLVGRGASLIDGCTWQGLVEGSERVGGLAGKNNHVVIESSASGEVWGISKVGGLVGRNPDMDEIYTSRADCMVYGQYIVGGFVGQNDDGGIISNCYSNGTVTGDERVGGFVGSSPGLIISSFWDMETSGQTTSEAGIGKTTAQMQTASTFLEAGWDFVYETENGTDDIWWIHEGQDYPRLWWETE